MRLVCFSTPADRELLEALPDRLAMTQICQPEDLSAMTYSPLFLPSVDQREIWGLIRGRGSRSHLDHLPALAQVLEHPG